MKKYSKIYKIESRKFRYNYKESLLELLGRNNEIIDEIGCNIDDWKESPITSIEMYILRLDEEMHYIMKDFEEEFAQYL